MSDKISLFDWVNDLSYDKKYLFNQSTQSAYNSFIINRAFGKNLDTLFFADEMNKHPNVSKYNNYNFYFYSLPKKKRYGKWGKVDKDKEQQISFIMKFYNVNRFRAQSFLKLLSKQDLDHIIESFNTGGLK